MEKKKRTVNRDFPKEKYIRLMSQNLPILRIRLGISQEELAELTGSSKQMISLIERGVRPMMWDTFMSMQYVFRRNSETRDMLQFFGIYTKEFDDFINIAGQEEGGSRG